MDGYKIAEYSFRPLAGKGPVCVAYKRTPWAAGEQQLHLSERIEIFAAMSSGDFVVSGSYYTLQPGDFLVVYPYEVHAAVPREGLVNERMYITVPPDLFSGFFYDPLRDFKEREPGKSMKFRPGESVCGRMQSLLRNAAETGGDGREEGFRVFGTVMEFLALAGREFGAAGQAASARDRASVPAVDAVIRYIEQHAPHITSVTEVAEALGLSLPYVSSSFRRCIGVTVSDYIRSSKIAVARRLLEQGCSVTYACYESGFNDCSHFIRCFRERLGETPLEYRKRIRGGSTDK